jgi:hypothetical protein
MPEILFAWGGQPNIQDDVFHCLDFAMLATLVSTGCEEIHR